MAKRNAEEMRATEEEGGEREAAAAAAADNRSHSHPYAFHVSGPRNISSPNWRDLINSSWKDGNYKRTVIACFIQAVYLLELDRQENRSEEEEKEKALAPKWWIPFKYKLAQTLTDERDGSIFGAILEWDRSAALSDFILIRPSGAPRAVLAIRGTLLKSATIRRDIEDDLRFLTWESLKGSVRFSKALEALKSMADRYGSNNVCVAGHSLGAGFALQVGKALAKQGILVETHLFNPPSVSLAMSLRNIGEKAGFVWKRFKSMLGEDQEEEEELVKRTCEVGGGRLKKKWAPHLYVNNSDYICCYYTEEKHAAEDKKLEEENNHSSKNTSNLGEVGGSGGAKLFVLSKGGKQKFQEAHGLEQWWSDDLQLQQMAALHNSKLINRQLKSLYNSPPQTTPN